MSKDPAFLFYPGDYLRDTQTLSEKSQVAYDRIMCEHMRNICISKKQLNFFTKRLNEDEKEELMFVLTKKSSGFMISWVAESIEKRKKYSDSRRKNREGSKKDMNNISKTYDSHMENENENENENKVVIAFKNNVKETAKELSLSDSIVNEFINHWTERDFESKCFAWQVPETFIIKSRLKGWIKNDEKNNSQQIKKDPFNTFN
jgi:hypothetical protein